MWRFNPNARVFLALGPTDMRKAINGLAAIVDGQIEGELFNGDFFAFTNKSRKLIKILYWSENGFCLWQKRLEKERFKWPKSEQDVLSISQREMAWLLDGLDIRQAHQTLEYSVVT